MAYVPSFDVDVFISYAHADNSGAERVTTFHKDLVASLTVRLGARAFHRPGEWVFFDRSVLKLGDEFSPKLERSARRSAIMISLISPSYLQARWCIHEARWFHESRQLARDPIERRLIPLLFNPVDERDLGQFPEFSFDRLRGSLCVDGIALASGTAAWDRALEEVAKQVADHLNAARRRHGAVYVGEAYRAVENLRRELIEDLRGFRAIPENAIFSQQAALRMALAEAKLAVHFLGDTDAEAATSAEAILWSLEHCAGKTVAYLPPGRRLTADEQQLVAAKRNDPKWTQPACTPTELAQILTRELESFRLPDPATPIALACDAPDLDTVRAIAREIHVRDRDAFAVGTPDFLTEPGALPFMGWKKLLTKSQSIVVYLREGRKQYLDMNVSQFLPAARLGRAWYVSLPGPETEWKREWQPGDPDTEVIIDEDAPFRYEQLQPFLKRVRERARK